MHLSLTHTMKIMKKAKISKDSPWYEILYGKRTLSKKVLDEILKVHELFRKDFKFRDYE